MKKNLILLVALFLSAFSLQAQVAYNPFTQNIHFAPEPTIFGFECGTIQTATFTMGLTTSDDATQWQNNPLKVTICLTGFTFNGPASSAISGSYASNFTWTYVLGMPNCVEGVQNQTLPGTGGDPVMPNPLSSGPINISVKVPESSPVGTILGVNVTLQVPTYMAMFNSASDDIEATQTQTFCNCYALTDAGTIQADQSFCGAGNPAVFTTATAASGGLGGTIQYQWQQLIGSVWTDIAGANTETYDAPQLSSTTSYRRKAKRDLCGDWINSNELVVTIHPIPTANAGVDKNLNCTTTSSTIGTTALAGHTYSWSPSNGLSSTLIAQPTASPTATTSYTVTVTNSTTGCTATDVVVVNVNTTPPGANAGPDKNLNCTTTSTTIGTAAVAGNTYSWSPSTALSSTSNAQPTANPTTTTTYVVTVTGSNGCTSTDAVIVNVNTTPPTANAGVDKNLNCTTTSTTIGTTSLAGNTYSWAPSAGLSATNIAQPIANPSATTSYTVTVTGSNGCTATDVVVVNVNSTPPTADAGADKNLNCSTTSTTIGTAAIAGNTYSWSPSNGLNSTLVAQPTASPSVTNSYTVTLTAANGCTSTDVVTVNVNTTPPTVNAGPDKNLDCSTTSTTIGTAATAGNTYNWSPSTGLSANNVAQPTASPTSTITYTLTVTGSNGCTASDVVTVNVNTTPPVADGGPNKNLNCTNTSTTIGVASVSGYSYSWSPATGLSATNIAQPTASPSVTTTYTVTVTGANGCTNSDVVLVNVNNTPPSANADNDKTLNCLTTSVQIGTPAFSGYTYSWSPATNLSSTSIAQPIASPGVTTTYTVTVTGTNGCTASDAILITVNTTPPTADAGVDKNLDCATTSTVIGTTALAGHSYSWSPSTGLSSATVAQPTASPSATTSYTVTVTGTNGCTATDVVIVSVNTTPPVVDAGPNQLLNCTTTSTTIGSVAIAGSSYSWSPSTGLSANNIAQPVASPSATTNYTVTATGSNGCTATDVVTVTVNTTPPTANAGTDKNLNCSITSTLIGTAASAGNTYSWAPATALSATNIAQPTANPIVTTSYTVTVTGSNGCTATDVMTVNVDINPPVVDAGPDKNLNCTTTSTTIGSTAIPGSTYSWSPSTALSSSIAAQPTASPMSTTTYTVTVTGSNGCSATDVVTVNVDNTPPTADAGSDKEVCSLNNVQIGTAALAGYSYSWAPSTALNATNIAQPTANPSSTISYTVTVTGTNGCTSTDVVVVLFREGSVGNFVWNDVNGDGINNEAASQGINGVTVELYSVGTDNQQGTNDDQLIASTTTANNNAGNPGYYGFKICNSGDYYVKFPTATNSNNQLTTQTATAATDNNSDANNSDGMSPVFNINTNGAGVAKDNTTIDAGYISLMSLGNLVWNDLDRDGIKDLNESGIDGAVVYLYTDNNNDGSADGPSIANVTTSNGGLYVFDGLTPGKYIVGVTPPAPASGNAFISSTNGEESNPDNNVDNNDNGINTLSGQTYSGTITLNPGAEPIGEAPNNAVSADIHANLTLDFAFYQPVNIGGNVFVDNNGPTNVDGTGTGSAGSTPLYANLTNPSGFVIAVVPVNPNGTYQFDDVTPNTNYCVVLSTSQGNIGSPAPSTTLPSGWKNVSEDCCDNTGNDGTTNGQVCFSVGTSDVNNVNFGITEPLSLGNLVWNDLNRDGIKDANESGIENAVVNLYEDANNDCTPDGAAIQTTATNIDGLYVFTDLIPGKYIVGVTPPVVSGGTYTSSAAGEETDPNANGDNNDNGINTVGNETRSCAIELIAGTEPSGETPNNGGVPDANANLTLDFGFFVCPDNWTPVTVSVCAGTTVNLQTLEPVGFTGGAWTQNGNAITNLNVSVGTYTYTYTNGLCTASGSFVLVPQIPDYAPTITITPGVINGAKPVRVIINVSELLNMNSCTPVYVFVPRLEPRYTFTWNPTATQIGTGPTGAVNNAAWQFFNTNPNFYVWKYIGNPTFPANGSSKFGYAGTYDPNNTDGTTTFSCQIFQGSGGEINLTNNTDSEELIYFRN
ncbi:MAG: hypothetical protein IPN26_11060 [Bacteroidetes bacterium]|nr:hypothetical protein [Bacteroidota bacterium]